MQTVSPTLYQILLSSERDLTPVDLFEFYPPTVTDLIPANAERRFASTSLVWFGWEYQQQAISRSDISRYMTEKFNSVNITLSNVDKTVSTWLNGISLEGYRVLVRTVSRRYSTDSLVLFVGRCEKPGDIDNASVTITAKQDLGTIENELPFGKYDLKCPLKFKGTDCLAGQTLAQKPQAYKEASTCNKSWSQCVGYGNQKAFQGFRYKAVIGSFKVNTRPAGMGAIFGSRRATKQWTSTDNFPIGQSIPLGLGRTQIDLQPVLYADTGEYLYGHFVAGEGPITEFADVRNTTAGWATTFQTLYKHNGQYGYNADQETDSALLGLEYYSSRAYVEATIKGNNPDAGDPAPTLAALVLWNKIPSIGYAGFDTTDFSDNPVEHVRYLLTDPRALNYPTTWIDDEVSYQTAEYCNEPLQDDSGCEEFWYDQNQGTAGTDWKRYRSTGVLDSAYYKYQLTPTDANRPQKIAAEYNAYDPENPPENPIPTTYYRKRYTSNWHLKEPVKVADFLFKHLLPSFRGYLVTGADGKLQIKSERPAITSYLRGNANYEQTSISVQDVTTLLKLQLNQLYVVIGAGTDTSETKRVRSIIYNDLGNYFTLSVTQGATRYSPTFVGGSSNLFTSAPAWNYLTIQSGGLPVIVNVNGETITASAIDATGATATDGAIAGEIAAKINAHATLSQYIEAVWNKDNPTIVLMRSKTGYVYFDTGLVYAHQDGEAVVHVNGVFGDQAFGVLTRSNIIRDSFKWPLGQRQTSYNQFAITYTDSTQDFQQTELRENDYDHQDKVNKINKLEISGACVDNYHQADRLVQAARYKYRDGDYFCSFQAAGSALLLEEGDIICVNHANMSGRRNELFRIEELRVTQDHRVNIVARLYAEQQFPSAATVRTVGLNTGSVWIAGTPPAVTGVTVTYSTIDSGRVNFDFGDFVGGQTARVEIKRPGDADWIPTGYEVTPDSLGRGAAELPGLKVNTLIRITPISSTGVEGTPSQVTVTSPLYQWPGSYPAASGYVLSSTTAGVLSWVAQSGGGGTPGGSDTQVQFNDGGSALGGDAGFTYNKTTNTATLEQLNLGTAGSARGILRLRGNTSGEVTLQPASTAGTYTLTLPGDDGNANQVLTTDGTGVLSWTTAAGGGSNSTADGRLTLTSGTPVTTSDVTAATTIYYTPYTGNGIALFDGSSTWTVRTFSELSLSLSGFTANTNYDIFAYWTGSAVALEAESWGTNTAYNITGVTVGASTVVTYTYSGTRPFQTNGTPLCIQGITGNVNTILHNTWSFTANANVSSTSGTITFHELDTTGLTYTSGGTIRENKNTRATALTLQNGVWVKSGATTRRYLGTIRINGTAGQTEDSILNRLVWNNNNRRKRLLYCPATLERWTVSRRTGNYVFIAAQNDQRRRVQIICGLEEDMVKADVTGCYQSIDFSNSFMLAGIGLDRSDDNSTWTYGRQYLTQPTSSSMVLPVYGTFEKTLLGFHYLHWTHYASTTGVRSYGWDAIVAGAADDYKLRQVGLGGEILG